MSVEVSRLPDPPKVVARFKDNSGIVTIPREIIEQGHLKQLRVLQICLVEDYDDDDDEEMAHEMARELVDVLLSSGVMLVSDCGDEPALMTGDEFEGLAQFLAGDSFPEQWLDS